MKSQPLPCPSRRARLGVSIITALIAALVVTLVGRSTRLDIDQVWWGARALLTGRDPYAAVGPGRAMDWPWSLGYPAPALLAFAPLASLPLLWARAAFAAIGAGSFAFAITREDWNRVPALASGSLFMAVTATQWSPLLTAAALLPGLAWVAVAKPNIGGALILATLRTRGIIVAVLGGIALVLASTALDPGWPGAWIASVGANGHFRAPVQHMGGPLLLLAAIRWRRPEARLLLALAVTPHTTLVYETVPLSLVARSRAESLALAFLSWIAWAAQLWFYPAVSLSPGATLAGNPEYAAYVARVGDVTLVLMYLPCLWLVLRRPSAGDVPSLRELGWSSLRDRKGWPGGRAGRRACPPSSPA